VPTTPPARCCAAWAWTTLAAAVLLHADPLGRSLVGRNGRSVDGGNHRRRCPAEAQRPLEPEDDGQFKRLVVEKHLMAASRRGWRRTLDRIDASGQRHHSNLPVCGDTMKPISRTRWRSRSPRSLLAISISTAHCAKAIVFHRVRDAGGGLAKPCAVGRVLSAEFVNGGKTNQALWVRDPMTD
jgi:hypothetical protein